MNLSGRKDSGDSYLKKKRFIAQRVYTVCAKINYKIVPLVNLKKIFTLWHEWN